MSFLHPKKPASSKAKLDIVETEIRLAQLAADEREPRVTSLWAWMLARRVANGIGADFEWTLNNPRRTGTGR